MPFRFPKFGPTTGVLLGILAVLVIGVALFDWNWFRHPLERYLIDRSHREIRIGDLHVDLGFSLEPTVRVRDVYIENAPWANKGPAAVAGEASFTFSLKSVWEGRPVISRLVLIDADVQLERHADGLRNWRLRNPEDRGPGRVKVLRMEPHRTKIRIIRRDIDLDVVAAASEAGANGQAPDASYPTRIDFKGAFGGTEFSGQLLTGALLTFLETGESFPMRGHASADKSRLDVDGTSPICSNRTPSTRKFASPCPRCRNCIGSCALRCPLRGPMNSNRVSGRQRATPRSRICGQGSAIPTLPGGSVST
jgi:hypothetical protein